MPSETIERTDGGRIEQDGEFEIRECITHERPVASGSNALIFKTEKHGDDPIAAIKVLKVYRAGTGEKEFKTLMRAHEILSQSTTAARVPRPSDFVLLDLSEAERQHLNSFGAHLLDSQPAEAFSMDFIEGKDFARIVYEEVIRRASREELKGFLREQENPSDLVEDAASLDYLFDIVRTVLKLEDSMRVDASGVPQQDTRILWRNSNKIFDFLSARGFRVHPRITKQLEEAVALLHKHGIYHNDLHERNIMIEGDISQDTGKVWLIDFGASGSRTSELETYRDDLSLVRTLRASGQTKDERIREAQAVRQKELEAEILRHTTSPIAFGVYERFSKLGAPNMKEVIARSLANSLQPRYELAALKLLMDNEEVERQQVIEIVERALALLSEKNTKATTRKPGAVHNPALQSLLRLALTLWQSE